MAYDDTAHLKEPGQRENVCLMSKDFCLKEAGDGEAGTLFQW
jgi:hypothetical protein